MPHVVVGRGYPQVLDELRNAAASTGRSSTRRTPRRARDLHRSVEIRAAKHALPHVPARLAAWHAPELEYRGVASSRRARDMDLLRGHLLRPGERLAPIVGANLMLRGGGRRELRALEVKGRDLPIRRGRGIGRRTLTALRGVPQSAAAICVARRQQRQRAFDGKALSFEPHELTAHAAARAVSRENEGACVLRPSVRGRTFVGTRPSYRPRRGGLEAVPLVTAASTS